MAEYQPLRRHSEARFESARPTPAALIGRGPAWITAIQRSAGNRAAVEVAAAVVQRGPSSITKADQQIEFDLHPDPRATGQPKVPGWRAMSLKGGTQIVYILVDSKTGEPLKVGKTTRGSFKARFGEYVSAGNKWGRKLKITMFTLRQRSGKTIGQFEAEIRAGMERAGHRLPWDNTNGRLGRVGKGIPVPKSLTGVEVIDTVEASAAAAAKTPPTPPRVPIASGPSVTPRTPTASGPTTPPREPIASGPTPRTPLTSGPTVKTPETVTPKVTAPRPGRMTGGRMLGTGVKVLGAIGYVMMVDELRRAFAGLGPQVDLEGLDPGDFDVGFEITNISIGSSAYINVRVERNLIFRKKFYVVKAWELV